MTLKEIAEALVDGCKTGKERRKPRQALPPGTPCPPRPPITPGQGRETAGLDGIKGKHDWWDARLRRAFESGVEGPFLHGDDRFAVIFEIDATDKGVGSADADARGRGLPCRRWQDRAGGVLRHGLRLWFSPRCAAIAGFGT
jgi:hypothetical protein